MKAYKLFEKKNGLPRTLVHGLPQDGQRSRALPLDTWLEAEAGTPGFNLFSTREAALEYLPRFTVRAPQLVLCEVKVDQVVPRGGRSQYYVATRLHIPSENWTP